MLTNLPWKVWLGRLEPMQELKNCQSCQQPPLRLPAVQVCHVAAGCAARVFGAMYSDVSALVQLTVVACAKRWQPSKPERATITVRKPWQQR